MEGDTTDINNEEYANEQSQQVPTDKYKQSISPQLEPVDEEDLYDAVIKYRQAHPEDGKKWKKIMSDTKLKIRIQQLIDNYRKDNPEVEGVETVIQGIEYVVDGYLKSSIADRNELDGIKVRTMEDIMKPRQVISKMLEKMAIDWAEDQLKQQKPELNEIEKKLMTDEMIYGMGILHIDRDGNTNRIEPNSEEYWKLRDRISKEKSEPITVESIAKEAADNWANSISVNQNAPQSNNLLNNKSTNKLLNSIKKASEESAKKWGQYLASIDPADTSDNGRPKVHIYI